MTLSDIATVLLRRRRLFVLMFLSCSAVVVAVTLLLPKKYETAATMYVSSDVTETGGDELVRTYAALAGNPNIADAVRQELPLRLSRSQLLSRMSFQPVPLTQLLEVSASASTAAEAREIANIYASVYAARVADKFAANTIQEKVSVSETAALPTSPAEPNLPIYIGLGLVLSALLAGGTVALSEARTPRPTIRADEHEVFGLPVLGRIPRLGERSDGQADPAHDAFQWLQTSFDATAGRSSQVLAVTSPSPGDGKSTIALHLAEAMVAAGERVALVDADLRRPAPQSAWLGENANESRAGLADYLGGSEGEIERLLTPHSELAGLHVMGRGDLSTQTPASLGAARFRVMLSTLSVGFDRVILDTPPISLGADAALVAAAADATLFIVDLTRTTVPAVRVGLDRLDRVGASPVGIVLNQTRDRFNGYHSYYESQSTRAQGTTESTSPS